MISRCCQVLLVAIFISVPASLSEAGDIAGQLDRIFLDPKITVEESKPIFDDAQKSFQTLKDYQKETDPERKKEVLSALRTLTERAIEDVWKGSNMSEVFANIKTHLQGTRHQSSGSETDLETLSRSVQELLTVAKEKLRAYYAASHRNRYDVEGIFFSGTRVENLFRKDLSLDGTSIGYFFLESFATILGLSWGIITMIISGM